MNAYRREIELFLRAARGEDPVGLPEEQLQLMAVIEAAYRSATERQEVTL
jgi:predicted dehydrogenase